MKIRYALATLLALGSASPALAGDHHGHMSRSTAVMPNAKAAFEEVQRLLADSYVDAAPSEDAAWTGAIDGLLSQLIQLEGLKVNALLDPDQLKELEDSMTGRIVGVGIVIRKFEGVVFVLNTLAGSPAAKAGLMPGDRILAIDRKPIKDLPLEKIVPLIRGTEGTSVDLTVQRDQRDWVQPLTRHNMAFDSVSAQMLPGKVGYLRIIGFHQNTPEQVDQAMKTKLDGAQSLVLDLRDCPGGLFEVSLAVADRFLPPGASIVSLRGRDGKDDVKKASKRDPGDALPISVLINHHTASSAEILAAALAANDRARLVGETTLGKGTVEKVVKLSNGWGLKLTTARFVSPKGKSWQGTGIEPDLIIAQKPESDEDHANHHAMSEVSPDKDPQLRAAITVLELRKR